MGYTANKARRRMATLPAGEGVRLISHPSLWVPTVAVTTEEQACTLVLPGIPKLFNRMLADLCAQGVLGEASPRHRVSMHTKLKEGEIAEALAEAEQA